jgi:hypothetical protein
MACVSFKVTSPSFRMPVCTTVNGIHLQLAGEGLNSRRNAG